MVKLIGEIFKRDLKISVMLAVFFAALTALLVYKLGSLVVGLSYHEYQVASQPVGWSGIYHNPFELPLKAVRSVVYFIAADHGQTLSRVPNALFGGLASLSFAALIWLWHGGRTAIIATLMFICSAWVLHISRYVGSEVIYLWAIPTLLLVQVILHRYGSKTLVRLSAIVTWLILLYIPGVIWLILAQIIIQRKLIKSAFFDNRSSTTYLFYAALPVILLPLLILNLTRSGQLLTWLGLPQHLPSFIDYAKNYLGVYKHLFIHGPLYPDIWLDQLPILDIFAIITAGLGIYFYAQNLRATRSKTLAGLFIIGTILVAFGGPVGISLLVALCYIFIAAGLAYLLHEWLVVFPRNPLARGVGIGLISLAVLLSCTYNLKAYFVAWPHSDATRAAFHYHR